MVRPWVAGGVLVVVGVSWAQSASAPVALRPPLPICAATVRALREAAGAAEVFESEHFVVAFTTRAAPARELAARLEAVYAAHVAFAEQAALAVRRPPHKLQVVLLATHAEFVEHLRRQDVDAGESLAVYLPSVDRCVFFDLDTHPPLAELRAAADASGLDAPRRRFERRRAALTLSVVQHEAAHHVQAGLGMVAAGRGVPTWLVEGLAMRFEVPLQPDGRLAGPRSGYRLYEFRRLHADRHTLDILPRLMVDDDAWAGGPSYPLAWALVEYLHEVHAEGFGVLVRRGMSAEGLPAEAARRRALFDELFGPVDAAWIDRFHAHVMAWPLGADYRDD